MQSIAAHEAWSKRTLRSWERSMANKLAITAFLFSLALGIGWADDASAQRRYSSPSGPTLSPYLDYFRRDVGLTNSYYNFVQPKRQLDQALREQRDAIQQLSNSVENQQRATLARPTGIGAGFMNHGSYFGGGAGPVSRGATVRNSFRAGNSAFSSNRFSSDRFNSARFSSGRSVRGY